MRRPVMICFMFVLALVFAACPKKETQTTSTDTTGTAKTDTTMTVPPPLEVTKLDATPENVKKAEEDSQKFAERDRKMHAILTFEDFKGTVYKEPFEGGKWIVNGDTPISDEKQLQDFYEKNVKPAQMPQGVGALILNQVGGLDDKWNDTAKKQIKYCVSTTFGGRHDDVVAQMASATGEWKKSADVDFVYVSSEDNNCVPSNNNVVFDVRPVNVNGDYLARAFFPNEPRAARNVLIDETSFELTPGGALTLSGILRHELGHTLGFRHEHTRPESGACFEDSDWKPLTSYDAFSVMHYPQCNGKADWSLKLTDRDRNGAACVYGPAAGFTMNTTLVDNPDKCAKPITPPTGQAKVENFASQSAAKSEMKQYGPFAAKAGSLMEAKIGGATASGDPDLYVRFAGKPTTSAYDCRPYTSSANETCALNVPAGATQFFVVVRGYTAAKYDLTVTHTP